MMVFTGIIGKGDFFMGRRKLNLTPEEQERKKQQRLKYQAEWMRRYRKLHPDRTAMMHIRYNQKVLERLKAAQEEGEQE